MLYECTGLHLAHTIIFFSTVFRSLVLNRLVSFISDDFANYFSTHIKYRNEY